MLERNRAHLQWLRRGSAATSNARRAEHGITAFPRWSGGDTQRLDDHLREHYDTSVVPGRWFEMADHFRDRFRSATPDFEEALNRLGMALDELQ